MEKGVQALMCCIVLLIRLAVMRGDRNQTAEQEGERDKPTLKRITEVDRGG